MLNMESLFVHEVKKEDVNMVSVDDELITARLSKKTRTISKKNDLFYLRKMAEISFDLWKSQEGGVHKPYYISKFNSVKALCSDIEDKDVFDNDREPHSKMFESEDEFLESLENYKVGVSTAKHICASCPLVDMCRTSSVAALKKKSRLPFGPSNITPDPNLIWGGLTPKERIDFFSVFKELVDKELGLVD